MTEENQASSTIAITNTDPVAAAMTAAGIGNDAEPMPTHAEPAEGQPDALEGKPEGDKPAETRKSREYAEAKRAKQAAAQSEARARAQVKQARDQAAKDQRERAELEALITGAKGDREKFRELLKRSGHTLDSAARLELGLDVLPVSTDEKASKAVDEIAAIRAELRAERDQLQKARQQEQSDQAFRHYTSQIEAQLKADQTDQFDLIKEAGAYPDVLRFGLKALQDEGWTEALTPEQERNLIVFSAKAIEAQLTEKADRAAKGWARSKKLQSLMGKYRDTGTGSSDPRSDNQEPSLDPDQRKLLDSIGREPQAKGNKFITNETTTSTRPAVAARRDRSDADREIDELVSRLGAGAKPL